MTDKYYETYYDKNYISQEPVLYQKDLFTISLTFLFNKDTSIIPNYKYYINNTLYSYNNAKKNVGVNELVNITFGPFQDMGPKEISQRPTKVFLSMTNSYRKIIFAKLYKLPDWDTLSYSKPIIDVTPLNLRLCTVSCFSLPGYRNPVSLDTYNKFTEINKENKTDIIIVTGDLLYLEPLNLTSEGAIQAGYNQLKTFDRLQGSFSNHVWITTADDHDLGYNDTQRAGYNINLLRNLVQKNFPLISQYSPDNYRANFTQVKNISFITLDDVSQRKINVDSKNAGDAYSQILGENQLTFLYDALDNVELQFNEKSLVFIISGKSMFGNIGGQTYPYCVKERDAILEYIKKTGLRNVCFLCGDSHFSDLSEYVADPATNQIIREIRNSAIGSPPREFPDENPYRVPGSFIGSVNNFGTIEIDGIFNNYKITYKVFSSKQEIYTYSWNINY